MSDVHAQRITCVEKINLKTPRPRNIGCNARIGNHGSEINDPVVRIHTEGGAVGVGWSRLDREGAGGLVGRPVGDLFRLPEGTGESGAIVDLPLWDLAAKLQNTPLYQLLGARGSRKVELYDGSVYIDDLEATDDEAVDIFRKEVKTGQKYGYRNFKIKIGRGARWMPIREGLDRDVLVIHTVREAAGPDAKILIDGNNGMTLNIALEVLDRCRDVGIFWIEEPFPEDPAFNEALKTAITDRGYDTLVADGESRPPENYFDLVEKGWIDLVQQDYHSRGLTWWHATARMIESWDAQCAPHSWGSYIERYHHAHFAASVPHYSLLETAPADLSGVILDGWEERNGHLIVPDTPGAGFDLDPEVIERGVREEGGFRVEA